ncbi:MAG TPA: membrane protein insertion efficiency factor YidD [Actinomycetes bacterium]|nr:membrane protein insertion efficiency factor YidD [Actinomycetes bacterium]
MLVAAIGAYQRWISPLLGNRCRFHPSCSVYAKTAIEVHGALRGSWLALRRLLKCQPFHAGGFDYVPPKTGRVDRDRTGYRETVSPGPPERGSS